MVVAGGHPLGVQAAKSWTHGARMLGQPFPTDWTLRQRGGWEGCEPRYQPVDGVSALQDWMSNEYVGEAASSVINHVDGYYGRVAREQGKAPRYFAEKGLDGVAVSVLCELCPGSINLFLVRDFRDQFCSVRAFNTRRGTLDFGQRPGEPAEEQISRLAVSARQFLRSWRESPTESYLIRYEDLVREPRSTLEIMFDHLGLAVSDETLEELTQRDAQETHWAHHHRTSPSFEETVGRWKRDLSPALCRRFEEQMGDVLHAFGYSEASAVRSVG